MRQSGRSRVAWIRIPISLGIFCVVLEITLRLLPGVIPLGMLEQFEPGLRSYIASERKLTTKKDTVLVPRDDGGPADRLWIYGPGVEIVYDFDEPRIVRTVRVDDRGFCNAKPAAYEASRFDVIVLGDSFSWCTAVAPEDTWASRLAEYTGRTTYNLAHPGRGLYEYLQLLKRFGLAKSPRVVVMNVYEGNDFRDAFLFHETMTDDGGTLSQQACPFDSPVVCGFLVSSRASRLGRHSYALNFLLAAAWELREMAGKGEIDFRYEVNFADGSSVGMNSRNGDRDEVEFARRLDDGSLDVSLFDPAMEELARLAREHDFAVVVTYTPSAYTAYGEMATFDDASIELTMRNYSNLLRAYFARRAGSLGFRYLDLTPALAAAARESSEGNLLYFRTNVHFTPTGHDTVARQIAPLVAKAIGAEETNRR